MKKKLFLLAMLPLVVSCNQKKNESETEKNSAPVEQQTSHTENNTEIKEGFDIEKIPYTTSNIGEFPFINLPQGLVELNKPLVQEFDVCFFPIDGIMTPYEGKLYKTFVAPSRGENFSQHYFEKSMAEYLKSIGAVKIFDGEITREEYNRYHKQDPNKGDEGDIGYADQNIKFWALRTKNQGNVYIQYTSNNAGASLNVLQENAFKQTITKITADEIADELNKTGKSILYINFSIDQSDITSDGQEVVNQIAEALKNNEALKIVIEGHTDNTGNAAHNKKLSNDRAHAVLQELTLKGIDESRLSAAGYGSDKPLVANDSEENKAKNRRVELVRIP